MFYTIDTSLNGMIEEDEYLEFSIAYGGCSDTKQIRRFQNKVKTRLTGLLTKNYGTINNFLSQFSDPIPIDSLASKLKTMGLTNN
jgi:hypothetical protein